MLYQLYETQRALMAPFSEFAAASAKLYDHPLSPFSQGPWAQRISASFDLLHRLAKDYEKPEFGIRSVEVDGIEVAVQEQVPIVKPFCRLIRFKRFSDNPKVLEAMKTHPTVLVIAPLSGHHSTLLRDTVRSLLNHHKVFITDWTDARLVPADEGPFHLNDYVRYVQDFLRYIGPEVNTISVCQPTVPVLAAVSLMATHGEPTPRTMTMMGGPIDARRSPTAVNNLAMTKSHSWFENNVIFRVPPNFPGAGRRVYPGFLQHTGFVAMNPDRHLSSHYDYFRDLIRGDDDSAEAHRQFYDEYNAVLDMPAEYYLETIQTVFQDFSLVNGTWDVDGTIVRPQDITTTAVLTVEGELDDISGAGQTKAAHDLCTSVPKERQYHYDVEGAGHYGIFSGRRWREMVYPTIRDFITRFNLPEHRWNLDDSPAKRARMTAQEHAHPATEELPVLEAIDPLHPEVPEADLEQAAEAPAAVATVPEVKAPKARAARAVKPETAPKAAKAARAPKAPKAAPVPNAEADPEAPVKTFAELVREGSRNLLAEAAFGQADDLTRIKGVGPKLEKMLNDIGVYYFWQVADWSPADVAHADAQLTVFKGRIERDGWVAQSAALAAEPQAATRPQGA